MNTSPTTFSDDFPFDLIADAPHLEDPGVKALFDWLGPYPVNASATRASFNRFCKLLEAVEAPWKDALVTFVANIKGGAYRREFGKTYNRRGGSAGTSFECSQTSSLFSLTSQAIGYDR
jgi:hypothetical protein